MATLDTAIFRLIRGESGSKMLHTLLTQNAALVEKNRSEGRRQMLTTHWVMEPSNVLRMRAALTTDNPRSGPGGTERAREFRAQLCNVWESYDPETEVPVMCVTADAPEGILVLVVQLP